MLLNKGFVIAGVSDLTDGASIRVYTQQAPTSASPVIISDKLTHGAADLKYLQSGQKYGIELGKDGQTKDKAILTAAYKVSYNLMGGRYPNGDGTFSNSIPAELVQYGGKAPEKTGASKPGATFDGWYKVGESSKYDFSKPVTSDLALEAHWTTGTFTVKFYVQKDGALFKEQSVVYGQAVDDPGVPTREGFDFIGWAFQTGYQSQMLRFDLSTPIRSSYSVFGVWRPVEKKHTVTFVSNGGSEVASQTVKDGERAVQPANPTKSGSAFAGWYVGDTGDLYSFSTPVTENITLKAHWIELTTQYTVTFNGNGAGTQPDPSSQTVNHGSPVAKPDTEPTRVGYDFKGWYRDADGKNAYNFSDGVQENLTLFAKWTKKTYTVTFNGNGEGVTNVPAAQTIAHGNKAVRPQNPTRDGYIFTGWFQDGSTNEYNFGVEVTGNLTLIAQWAAVPEPPEPTQQETVTVTFNSAGGSTIAPQTINSGSKATRPADPTREGYRFVDWYNGGTLYKFDATVSADLTLTAKWEPLQWLVLFDYNDGVDGVDYYDAQVIEHGKQAAAPSPAPEREGYVFDGWFVNGMKYDFSMPVTADLTLTAHWTAVSYTVTCDVNGGSCPRCSIGGVRRNCR